MTAAKDDPFPRDDAPADACAVAPASVLLLDIEPAMAELFDAWLSRDGLCVRNAAAAGEPVALILIDLPFPRQDGAKRLQLLGRAWPGVPILVLSSTFFAGVSAHGEVARQLGAAAVLAAPVARDTLREAVSQLLQGR